MLRALSLILLGIASPVLAQQSPLGIVGTGDQTQSISILDSAVTVTLESSGDFSLGRGEPSAGGGFNLSVNDTTIVGVKEREKAEAGDAQGTAPGAVPNSGNSNSASTSGGTGQAAATGGAASSEIFASGCDAQSVSAQALGDALKPGQRILLQPMDCLSANPAAAKMVAQHPALSQAISDANMSPEDVVSVLVSDDLVIVGLASQR